MRFCLVSTQPNWGGGEALLWSMGQELQAMGHQVGWMARVASGLSNRIQENGGEVLHLHEGRGLSVGQWWATVRSLRSWAPDILIANDTHAVHLVGSAAWLCRRPMPIRLAYKHTVFPMRSRVKYRCLSDKLVCVSRAAQKVVEKGGVPTARTAVIYGGCAPAPHDPEARTWAEQEFGLSKDDRLLVCVGNLLACKGHSVLIDAMSLVVRKKPRVQLLIAGEGEERERLEKRLSLLGLEGRVRLLGYRSDADRLLDAADLVVHPSLSEGLSLVLIQAQMLAKPIVATAVGGTAEVLVAEDPSQCTAWLAEPGDSASLAEQVLAACEALASDSGALALGLARTAKRTRAQFGLRVNAQRLVELAAQSLQ
jgi:glycosyltransferase involved in cell wall biosynthesis